MAAFPATTLLAQSRGSRELLTFIGTYTRDDSKGIYSLRFNPASGKMSAPQLAVETPNPSFLVLHPDRRVLYACGEGKEGTVSAFAIDRASGKLSFINSAPSGGSSPCHLVVDVTKKNLIVVNYGAGSTAVIRVKEDGSLGEQTALVQHQGSSQNERRQKSPHAHSVNLSKNNRFAVVADLGTDEYIVYALDSAEGKLQRHSAAKVRGGSGPRHFAFHPTYRYAFGLNEMGSSVTAFRWDEGKGVLQEIATHSTLPDDFKSQNDCSEVLVHPGGRFVYAANRGHDSITIFDFDSKSGGLKTVDHVSTQGKVPRNFRLTPDGNWLIAANQNSASLVVFEIDKSTGKLTPNGQTTRISFPVCIKFLA